MWNVLFDRFLTHLIRQGDFSVTMPDGVTRRYGDGSGARMAITLLDRDLPRKIILGPDMAVGEAYMDGRLLIGDDDLHGFLGLVIRNLADRPVIWWQKPLVAMRHALRHANQFNPISRARQNVAHHYDLSGELYDLFLDADRQYSCAYFTDPDMPLEDAQAAKKKHIAGKLKLKPGMRVLDIGCGWGGLALTLARDYGVSVVGVTLSREQHLVATRRALAEGLADRVEFRLIDYRNVTEQFDRIVSVGMFEHVGVPHYREYFDHVKSRLTPDGVALIHTIGRSSPPGATSPWVTKYIFPGGYCPALSEMITAAEKADIIATDVEVWRGHYAQTLLLWHDRFVANRDKVCALYDERFYRMWRYYLVASELTFRLNRQVVFQVQLANKQDAVPLTRDYMYPPDQPKDLRHAAE